MDELLHLDHLQEELESNPYTQEELETLIPIIRRAIESGDTSELEEWAR